MHNKKRRQNKNFIFSRLNISTSRPRLIFVLYSKFCIFLYKKKLRRKARIELLRMNDRQLRDIGLTRDDLPR
ncbi:DUF1127 domain-containing protein [Sodalis sp. RH16]|uniref:DUF1127 domain-containing protein n=1 Tax=unclassified Sodalis (in: enterobacteria) TaxID=2636512 RepID=UPI0039B3B6AB